MARTAAGEPTMAADPVTTPSLLRTLRPLLLVGWTVAALRLLAEFVAPEQAMFFGVYYVMPVAYLWFGVTGRWTRGWPAWALASLVIGALVWGVPNAISYTCAQFLEWTHGRFAADRAPPVADSVSGKVVAGLLTGAVTSLAGAVWTLVTGTVLVWLPERLRRTEPTDAAS